jgi:hypothetical protein
MAGNVQFCDAMTPMPQPLPVQAGTNWAAHSYAFLARVSSRPRALAPPVTVEGFARVRGSGVTAGQRITVSLAVRSHSPLF